jgi:hypothetical protein
VVRIGGVPHPQKKSQRDDGKKSDHSFFRCLNGGSCRATGRPLCLGRTA